MDDPDLVVQLVNAIRATYGLMILHRIHALDRSAQIHAEDMALYRYHSHTGRDGDRAATRIARTGYLTGAAGYVIGENVAYGYLGAEDVVKGWMDSPGHRANILDGGFIDTGVGLGMDDKGALYWVQVFGTRYEP